MRLDYLCDFELAYRKEAFGEFVLLQPWGGKDGVGYGEGIGKVVGDRLRGQARWVNHPKRRSDGTYLPDAHGVILTDDGATILFSLRGRTTWVGAENERIGRQNLVVFFEAEDERYRWLSDAVCVLEGIIDPRSMQTVVNKVYVCVNELV